MVVDDGQIMVLGGQMKDSYVDGESKVPVLGDIPMMGNLFRSENRTRNKSVLLVFLRPVVMRDAQAANALTVDRYEAIRARQQDAQPAPSKVLKINDAPQLPPMPGSAPAIDPATGAIAVPPPASAPVPATRLP